MILTGHETPEQLRKLQSDPEEWRRMIDAANEYFATILWGNPQRPKPHARPQ